MRRFNILQGDPTTAGHDSKVIGAVGSDTNVGRTIALEGDDVWCGVCRTVGKIVGDGPRLSQTFRGRQAALSGDLCMCRCRPVPRLINSRDNMTQTMTTDEVIEQGYGIWVGVQPHDEQFVLRHKHTGRPLAGVRYRVRSDRARVIHGVTDADGATRRIETNHAEGLRVDIALEDLLDG